MYGAHTTAHYAVEEWPGYQAQYSRRMELTPEYMRSLGWDETVEDHYHSFRPPEDSQDAASFSALEDAWDNRERPWFGRSPALGGA